VKEEGEREPGGPGADDANLCAQLPLLRDAVGKADRMASIYAVRIVSACAYSAHLVCGLLMGHDD